MSTRRELTRQKNDSIDDGANDRCMMTYCHCPLWSPLPYAAKNCVLPLFCLLVYLIIYTGQRRAQCTKLSQIFYIDVIGAKHKPHNV
jgi:hypothetical protein